MTHGGDIYTFQAQHGIKPLDFSENTNPLGLPSGVKQAIAEHIDAYAAYPDLHCRALTSATATYYNVKEEYILFGNGAADLIFKIAYCLKPKEVVLLAPTFAEYEIALRNAGATIVYYPLHAQQQFAIQEDILPLIAGKTVFICNPNNPTGQLCSRALLAQIATVAKNLIIDECFMDFVQEADAYSFVPFLTQHPHVIILKAFTKIFAMAGLRLGFCLCADSTLLAQINEKGQPWSVSTVAQIAGIAACNEHAYVTESLALIAAQRTFLQNSLQNFGYTIYESHANYILFRAKKCLAEQLAPQGIMIRSCANYHGLSDEFYRIAVKTPAENQRFIKALENISAYML